MWELAFCFPATSDEHRPYVAASLGVEQESGRPLGDCGRWSRNQERRLSWRRLQQHRDQHRPQTGVMRWMTKSSFFLVFVQIPSP